MRIGIVPSLDAAGGGIYQYSLTMLRTLHEWKSCGSRDEFMIFADSNLPISPEMPMNAQGWSLKPLTPMTSEMPGQFEVEIDHSLPPRSSFSQRSLDFLRRGIGEGPHREGWRALRRQLRREQSRPAPAINLPDPDKVYFRSEMHQWFLQCGTEMMIYPAPKSISFEAEIPFIMAIHDLQHRLQPEFPEVSANGEWEGREYLFRNAARYATLLLADSEVGKEDILNFYGCYGVTPDRVKVLPFTPTYSSTELPEGERERVRTRYQLPERYLFYPAQFWPHKNHARIVQALGLLKQEYSLSIPIVFCGSYADEIRERTWREALSLACELGLDEEIQYLGYVPDEDMCGIYAQARALVMPTFFGPTNIPVLEAWAFGCPVITSDIRGIREQAGDAAVLVDPRSVEAIADGIYRLWTDDNLCRELAGRGRQRLSTYTPEDYRKRLIDILEEAKGQVRSEKKMGARRSNPGQRNPL